DFHVTGVQTCALPISVLWERSTKREPIAFSSSPPRGKLRRHQRKYATGELGPDKCFYFTGPHGKLHLSAKNLSSFLELAAGLDRSEERRVGKEGGSRG